ncbi:unnamed protein product, partial [Rangifer tarandus platyrhynchus]
SLGPLGQVLPSSQGNTLRAPPPPAPPSLEPAGPSRWPVLAHLPRAQLEFPQPLRLGGLLNNTRMFPW